MKAYTYLIINTVNFRWYYGVRYAVNCRTDDLFKSYFTSSKLVKADIKIYGKNSFKYQVRRTFDNIEDAIKWESKVLVRMNSVKREDSYNLNDKPAPPIGAGGKRSDATYKKISVTKMTSNIIKVLRDYRTKSFDHLIQRKNIKRFQRYIQFIDSLQRDYKRIKTYLCVLFEMCDTIQIKIGGVKKGSKRRATSDATKEAISRANRGGLWYTSSDLLEMRQIKDVNLVPEGWIKGMKNNERIQKARDLWKGRSHSEESKKLMSENAKKRIYATSSDLQELRIFYSLDDIPEGWILGNKLKTRNEKISKNHRNRCNKHEKNQEH